jgi:hypothetical protein
LLLRSPAVFNLLPGHGLGFTGSQEIAFGLAAVSVTEVVVPPVEQPPFVTGGGGGYYNVYRGPRSTTKKKITLYDNLYSLDQDDNDIVEITQILFGVLQ